MILLGAGFLIGCRQGEDHSASVRKEETTTGTAGESKEKTAVRADGESKEKTTDAQEGTSAEKEGTAVTQDSKKALSDTDFSLGIKVISMFTGDLVNIPLTIMDQAADGSEIAFRWENQQPDIVEVRSDGTICALKEGNAVVTCRNSSKEESVCVNVYDGFGGGSWWDMALMTGPDQITTYRNYSQGAYEYGMYSDYVAWHGCALCCTTTIVGAWYPEEGWSPDRVISELEREADQEGFRKNYAKSLRKQMPLSLKGISRVLALKEIPHTYVTEFDKDTLTDELDKCLREGHPVIYEAGNGGYHMMLLLGILADGNYILSDSVGTDRVRPISPEAAAAQMFSCKKEPVSSYFAGRKTAGGYIIVGEE